MRIDLLAVLEPFRPSRDALFEWLSEHMTPGHLDALANSDLADDDEASRIVQQLQEFLHRSKAPQAISDFIAFEELGLERWRHPKDGFYGSPTDCHLVHAFSCACLVLAASEPGIQPYVLSENETLIELVRSVLYLGDEASRSTQSLLAWRLLSLPNHDVDGPFFGLGLLLLALRTGTADGSVEGLCDWITHAVDAVRKHPENALPDRESDWLLGLNFHNQRNDLWQQSVQKTLLRPPSRLPAAAARQVRTLGRRVLERA